MIIIIQQFWNSIFSDPVLIERLCQISEQISYRKQEIILTETPAVSSYYFLVRGLLKEFYITENGREIIDRFYFRSGSLLFPKVSLLHSSSCEHKISALEDSICILVQADQFDQLMETCPEISALFLKELKQEFSFQYSIRTALVIYDAFERVRWFHREFPELSGRVRQKQLSAFLQLSQNTLSKIHNNSYLDHLVHPSGRKPD